MELCRLEVEVEIEYNVIVARRAEYYSYGVHCTYAVQTVQVILTDFVIVVFVDSFDSSTQQPAGAGGGLACGWSRFG